MAYCGPRGIPYTTFISDPSDPPEDGWVLGAWDDLSRAAAIAWERHQAATCTSCGMHRAEWLDEDGNPIKDHRHLPWRTTSVYCRGCELVAMHKAPAEDEQKRRAFHTTFVPASGPQPR